jgi:Domain of unknown function (DUF4188)
MFEKYKPYRFSADLSKLEGENLLLVKLGFYWHSLKGFCEFLHYLFLIKKANKKAKGLYKTEYFLYSQNHAGFLQYWLSFQELEEWACKGSEHTSWWKEMETQNKWKDMSAYHEVYIVDKNKIETIYNLPQNFKYEWPGLGSFLPHISPAYHRARDRFNEINL